MAEAIMKPSVVYIAMHWKGYVRVPENSVTKSGTFGPYEADTTCSGFVANSSGYIVTAGHCVDDQSMMYGGKEQIIVQFLLDAEKQLNLTDSQANKLIDAILGYGGVEGEISGSPPDRTVTVYQTAAASGAPAANGMPADVVDYKAFKEGDVALLKVQPATPMPALEVAPQVPQEGAQIISGGYPGEVSQIVDPKAQPSFTPGSTSGTKTVNGVPFTEISPAAMAGMSGGPVADMQSRVVGTVSFNPSDETTTFNFITDTGEVRALLSRNGVSNQLSSTDQAYRAGLTHYFAGQYQAAVNEFHKVLAVEPDNLQAKYYMSQSSAKVQSESSTPSTAGTSQGGNSNAALYIGLGLAVVAAAAIILALVVRHRRRRMAATAGPLVTTGPMVDATGPIPKPPLDESAPFAPGPEPHAEGTASPSDGLRCPNCGTPHPAEAHFCASCGQPFASAAPGDQGTTLRW